MVKIEIRKKIITVRKQLGNLKSIFKVDTYFELKTYFRVPKYISEF